LKKQGKPNRIPIDPDFGRRGDQNEKSLLQPAKNAYDHHAHSRYRVSGTAYSASSVLIYSLLSHRFQCSTLPTHPVERYPIIEHHRITASSHMLQYHPPDHSKLQVQGQSLVSVPFPLLGISLPNPRLRIHPSKRLSHKASPTWYGATGIGA
jgi:hypothetical protein